MKSLGIDAKLSKMKLKKTHKMIKAFLMNSALHPKTDVHCEKLKCQQLAQSAVLK